MEDKLNLEIDPERLADEWKEQPTLFLRWASKVADAQSEYDEAKAALELERAEVDRDIRDDPKSFGLDKITETAIAGVIATQKSYQLSNKRVIQARHALDVAKAAVTAIEHRKKALEMLVELWIRDYYADPKPRARTEESEQWSKNQARTSGRNRRSTAVERE